MLVLDSGAVSFLSGRSTRVMTRMAILRRAGDWPPVVPSVVLIECLTGNAGRDARTNLFLKGCFVREQLSQTMARRAALLRTQARTGSAVDALTVAMAEPGGTVLTTDPDDLEALAAYAIDVIVEAV